MDLDPPGKVLRVRQFNFKSRQIQPAFVRVGVVTFVAVLREEHCGLFSLNTHVGYRQQQSQKKVSSGHDGGELCQ